MKFTPKPYQVQMMRHAASVPRCGLWAGMGLGKTSTCLTMISDCEEFVGGRGRTLVLAPLRVAQSTWPDEAEKWDHLKKTIVVSPIVGSAEQRRAALRRDANVFTMNYENIPWLIEELAGRKWPFSRVISDESTRLKSFRLRKGSKRAQALGRIAHRGPTEWINLTGTPAPNGLQDLWGQTWFLDAGARLGRTFSAFCNRWFQTDYDGFGLRPLPFAQEQIQDRLQDICLSIELPDRQEPIVNNIYVELPTRARQRYREMEREMFTMLEGHEIEAFNAASRTMKCLQLASGAVYLNPDVDGDEHPKAKEWTEVHTAKLDALESVIEESAGMPVLVAYHFKSDLTRLLKAFPKARELDRDPATIRQWNAGKIPILLAHPQSAGHGLNLQDGGNIVVFFSHNWNLEEYQQIIERIGPVRQLQAGHPRPVFVHHLVAKDTVDELVILARDSKRRVQDVLIDAMKKREAA